MVRRPPAVELLPLWGRRPRRGRDLLLPDWPRLSAAAAAALVDLAQRLASRHGDGGRAAEVAAGVVAQVVLRHCAAPQGEGARGGGGGGSGAVRARLLRGDGLVGAVMMLRLRVVVMMRVRVNALQGYRVTPPPGVVPGGGGRVGGREREREGEGGRESVMGQIFI